MIHKEKATNNISYDVSLRFWSDDTPLLPLIQALNIRISQCHIKGEPVLINNKTKNVSKNYYLSAGDIIFPSKAEVLLWLENVIELISRSSVLSEMLRCNKIEAVFWIAIFGDSKADIPQFTSGILNEIEKIGIKILIENYTDLSLLDGNPAKIWFP